MEVKFKVEKVLVPIDFSDTSRKAFYVALKLGRQYDATVDVLHVMEPIASFDSAEDMERQANELKRVEDGVHRRVTDLFKEGGLAEVDRRKVRVEIRAGKPWLEILRFAWQNETDLIVMGSHGYTGVKHMLIGSQTDKVVRRAHCMVLTIKPDDFEVESDISGVPKKKE
ncbi:MAG: universal stress protein [Deltaproteobacteria bacterium]|nr:universal stress protein [Deltaproteobacteria bacterium]